MGVLSSGEAGKSPINIAHRCNFLSYFPCPYLLIPFSTYSYFACCYICARVCVCVCVGLTASGSTSGGHYVWAGFGGVGGAGLAVQ